MKHASYESYRGLKNWLKKSTNMSPLSQTLCLVRSQRFRLILQHLLSQFSVFHSRLKSFQLGDQRSMNCHLYIFRIASNDSNSDLWIIAGMKSETRANSYSKYPKPHLISNLRYSMRISIVARNSNWEAMNILAINMKHG